MRSRVPQTKNPKRQRHSPNAYHEYGILLVGIVVSIWMIHMDRLRASSEDVIVSIDVIVQPTSSSSSSSSEDDRGGRRHSIEQSTIRIRKLIEEWIKRWEKEPASSSSSSSSSRSRSSVSASSVPMITSSSSTPSHAAAPTAPDGKEPPTVIDIGKGTVGLLCPLMFCPYLKARFIPALLEGLRESMYICIELLHPSEPILWILFLLWTFLLLRFLLLFLVGFLTKEKKEDEAEKDRQWSESRRKAGERTPFS